MIMKKQLIFHSFLLVLAFLLVSCTPTADVSVTDGSTESTAERVQYEVQVLTEGGMPLEGLRADIYTDDTCTTRLRAAETDEDGKFSFEAERSDRYTMVLSGLPLGYVVAQSYAIDEQTTVTLSVEMIDGSDLNAFSLTLGSIARDCTVTATDGTVYSFAELLETKKAIVLNFWFIGCDPCRAEFPHLQNAYEAYSDDVIVLAINPCDGTNESVAAYASAMGLTFPMVAGDEAWANCMGIRAYPTTVVIDRYGLICFKLVGSVTAESVFETIFAHFAEDDYQQKIFRDPKELIG